MSLIEEKAIEQFTEIATSPLKCYMESKTLRKKMLMDYGVQKEIELMDQVMKSDSISLEHKALLTAQIKSGAKKFYNQLKILDIAIDKLENKNATVIDVNKDWINDFWEKAKNISDEKNQYIWGNVLSFNFTEGCCTKTLLNALYLLDKKKMHNFDIIRKFTFRHATDLYRIYSCIYITEDKNFYHKNGLYRFSIDELMRIGLIEYNWDNEYTLPTKKISLKYDNRTIQMNSNKKIKYGNVRYTSDGSILFHAISPLSDMNYFEYCIEKWKSCGVTVSIE